MINIKNSRSQFSPFSICYDRPKKLSAALTTDRPYRKAIEKTAAIEELEKDAKSHFDPFLVKIFSKVKLLGIQTD